MRETEQILVCEKHKNRNRQVMKEIEAWDQKTKQEGNNDNWNDKIPKQKKTRKQLKSVNHPEMCE